MRLDNVFKVGVVVLLIERILHYLIFAPKFNSIYHAVLELMAR